MRSLSLAMRLSVYQDCFFVRCVESLCLPDADSIWSVQALPVPCRFHLTARIAALSYKNHMHMQMAVHICSYIMWYFLFFLVSQLHMVHPPWNLRLLQPDCYVLLLCILRQLMTEVPVFDRLLYIYLHTAFPTYHILWSYLSHILLWYCNIRWSYSNGWSVHNFYIDIPLHVLGKQMNHLPYSAYWYYLPLMFDMLVPDP